MHIMYENEDIVVIWDPEKCFHAMQCVHGSPPVPSKLAANHGSN